MTRNEFYKCYKGIGEKKYPFNQEYIKEDYAVLHATTLDNLVSAVIAATGQYCNWQLSVVNEYYKGTQLQQDIVDKINEQINILNEFMNDWNSIKEDKEKMLNEMVCSPVGSHTPIEEE